MVQRIVITDELLKDAIDLILELYDEVVYHTDGNVHPHLEDRVDVIIKALEYALDEGYIECVED